jgi:cyclic beta-1,2-glucan synthetase
MGWERKRGAILELTRLLGDERPSFYQSGYTGRMIGIQFIIALNADTRLCAGSARELVGACTASFKYSHH